MLTGGSRTTPCLPVARDRLASARRLRRGEVVPCTGSVLARRRVRASVGPELPFSFRYDNPRGLSPGVLTVLRGNRAARVRAMDPVASQRCLRALTCCFAAAASDRSRLRTRLAATVDPSPTAATCRVGTPTATLCANGRTISWAAPTAAEPAATWKARSSRSSARWRSGRLARCRNALGASRWRAPKTSESMSGSYGFRT